MATYLEFFFSNSSQVLSIVATVVVWLGLSLIGGVITGPNALRVAAPFYGWAVAVVFFTFSGVYTSIPFSPIAMLVGVLAICAGIYLIFQKRIILKN